MQLVTPQTGGGDRRDPASRPTAEEAAAKRVSLRPLLGLRPYLLRHRGMLAAAFAALVISAAATLAVPLAVRRMIDLGFSGIDPDLIDKYFLTLAGIGLILALASAARFYTVNWLGERVVADIRRDVFKHLTGLSPAFYEVSHSGEVMSRLTADTTQVKGAASTVISQALRNVLLLVGAAIMMVVTSPKLSLAVLIAIPVIMLPLVAYGRSVRTLSRQAQDTLAQASAYASESLTQVRVMQAFTHEDAAAKRFGAGRRPLLRGGECAGQGARRTHGHRHLPRVCQRRRRAVVRRARRAVGTHDRRQALAVRALRRARRDRGWRLERNLGRDRAMHGRRRASERVAASSVEDHIAARAEAAAQAGAWRDRLSRCVLLPIRCGPRRARSSG